MDYTHLTQEEMDDHIAEGIRGRQLEHFHHSVNVANYAEMLKVLPKGEWRDRIQQLHDEGLVEMAKIEGLHDALVKQVPPGRLAQAKERVAAKRAAQG